MNELKIYWIDLFCGAGGTSSGIHLANPNTSVLACVNHDKNAIKSHFENHPNAHHFTEDIRDFKVVVKLKKLVDEIRLSDPYAIISIWASLECTNFSKAKGGQSRDADSRTLAEHMFMYLLDINPDYFWVENVREFMSWGPLDEKGKPVSKTEGKDYLKWVDDIRSFGYRFDWRILNSANYGAYQSRERLFLQFAKHDFPISWPEQTHTKDKLDSPLFPMEKWKPVREVLDLHDEGVSIFQRKKNLSENTLKRIYAGLEKFVAKGDDKFLKKYFAGRPKGKVNSIDNPAGTVTTVGGQALVSITNTASHLSTYYGNFGLHSIDNPSPTITTKDRVTKIDVNFIDQQYGTGCATSIEKPIGTLTTIPKFNLINAQQYIFNPAWGGNNGSIDNPCCTIVARQDKASLYLVSTELGRIAIPIYENDSETMISIKEFMVVYGIIDIKMRMLNIPELKQIQGFPKDYKLIGNQTEQKKFIGNAVEVNQAKALVSNHYKSLQDHFIKVAV
ncbi:DNA cytosine methyltransferase [Flavobacterium sp. 3-210]